MIEDICNTNCAARPLSDDRLEDIGGGFGIREKQSLPAFTDASAPRQTIFDLVDEDTAAWFVARKKEAERANRLWDDFDRL